MTTQTAKPADNAKAPEQPIVPRFLTVCDVPDGVERRFYYGVNVFHAECCLKANEEDNAASWMWRDWSELDEGFAPVAGTLRAARRHDIDGILYVDARDVAKAIENMHGGGI